MRVLFITTRSPDQRAEEDGGSIFASQFIRNVQRKVQLDILFIRSSTPALSTITDVNMIHQLTPNLMIPDRFERRLEMAPAIREWMRHNQLRYDMIVAQHVSSAFGIPELGEAVTRKLVVFPMFTGTAYKRSREIISKDYIGAEANVLRSAGLIVCPSISEITDITKDYDVDESRFERVPFAVDLTTFAQSEHLLTSLGPRLLCVGTLKQQKNQLSVVRIVECLRRNQIYAKASFVGGIADPAYYTAVEKEIEAKHLQEQIVHHGVLTRKQIVALASSFDISISASRWETFGIAIFESLAMGMPAIVYDDIPCFREYLLPNGSCIGVPRTTQAMADMVTELYTNPVLYRQKCTNARAEVAHLDEESVTELMLSKLQRVLGAGRQ